MKLSTQFLASIFMLCLCFSAFAQNANDKNGKAKADNASLNAKNKKSKKDKGNKGVYKAGEKFDTKEAVTVEQMLQSFTGDEMVFVVVGTVEKVCQVKGCWMHLVTPENTEPLRITFKDYEFFVPKDAAGREAYLKGTLKKVVTPVADLRHYAVDGGMSEKEANETITEPKVEYAFVADGVVVK